MGIIEIIGLIAKIAVIGIVVIGALLLLSKGLSVLKRSRAGDKFKETSQTLEETAKLGNIVRDNNLTVEEVKEVTEIKEIIEPDSMELFGKKKDK